MSGLLHVTTQPSSPNVPQSHFTDWYNNEHGPNRLRLAHHFPHGHRYKASDNLTPPYLAIYDVKDAKGLFSDPTYTSLRTNRSEREARVIAAVNVNRQLLSLVSTRQAPHFQQEKDIVDGAVAVQETLPPEALDSRIEAVALLRGWLRTRVFRKDDNASLLALHDFSTHHDPLPSDEAVKDQRLWSLIYVFGPAPRDLASLAAKPRPEPWSVKGTATTPGDDPTISSYVTADDGVTTIPYRLEGNAAPGAPVVAMSNSLLTSLEMWDPLVQILRRRRPDLAILRYDSRGRHRLPPQSSSAAAAAASGITIDLLASDLNCLLSALRIRRLHALIGVSIGGATTLRFSQLHPERVSRLIGCDFNAVSTPANAQAWRDRARVPLETLAEQTVDRWIHPRNAASVTPWLVPMLAANDPAGFRAASQALYEYDLCPDAPTCEVPTLLVVGDVDAKGAMRAAMAGFAPNLGPRGATLRVVMETGHVPMCEDPEAFWDTIRDFL
ncbi:hypothetical protein L249_3204 [Ophiocordyceps polyrhachis-furcata BCC 54312]|uniref:AB hydrolase-1 domain-containing protein n=1 Tax=Ophiocordyceps polyrhachis-furcata BCC 54312 TaxID=1330021 RepID=A0A367LPF9_9HYPO|nr:hypothetical protein L249_3204 [Ophiocordyceps polyrhachis-furcata BCC 54312]